MNESVGTLYLLCAAGHADLGIGSKDAEGRRALIDRLERTTDPQEIARILRLRLPEQNSGEEAPLASGLKAVSADPNQKVCLVIGCTDVVADIAGAIKHGLTQLPDVYGRQIDQVSVAYAASLEEAHVIQAYQTELKRLGATSDNRAVLLWGSGSTQLILGATEATTGLGIPWALALVAPDEPGRMITFDPTAGLPIDPLVPLLRRWRYHDLLWQLVDKGIIHVDPDQQKILQAEAEQWGHAYVEPNAARLRTVMAAALMRGDASGGFAVRAYVEQRYTELYEQDGSPVHLLKWADERQARKGKARRGKGRKARNGEEGSTFLGLRLKAVREITANDGEQLVAAKTARSGRWLTSHVVDQLNEMGKRSSHELRPPTPEMLQALQAELTECGDLPGPVDSESLTQAKLHPLTLLPARTVWYLSILGDSKPGHKHVIEQIAEATADQGLHARIDVPVRTYLGLREDEAMPMALLILGTQSGTIDAASGLANRLNRPDRPAIAAMIPDGEGSAPHAVPHPNPRPTRRPGQTITPQQAKELLRGHLSEDAGALVVIPTGPKPHVLPLLTAAQQIAAERGIPLFLRQLVTRNQQVEDAGTHRLPMRFGTDLGVLSAALHALEIAELDTAARLLGVTSAGQDLAARAAALSAALRCELVPDAAAWPAEVTAGLTPDKLTLGLLADRIEVWAKLPHLNDDLATQSRALIGACATADSSVKAAAKVMSQSEADLMSEMKTLLRPMRTVRNKLPVTHGTRLTEHDGLDTLVARQTKREFHNVPDLLAAMVRRARDHYGLARVGGPSLAQLLDGVRQKVRQLREAELNGRAGSGQVSVAS